MTRRGPDVLRRAARAARDATLAERFVDREGADAVGGEDIVAP